MAGGLAVAGLVGALLAASPGAASAQARVASIPSTGPAYYVAMDPPIIYPGAVVRFRVRATPGIERGSLFVAGRRFLGRVEDGIFTAYFAVDLDTLPGPYELSWDLGTRKGSRVVTVRARRFDDEGRVQDGLSRTDEALENLVQRSPRLLSLWHRTTLERYWSGSFLVPVAGPMVGTFGARRGTESSLGRPHTGVVLAGSSGASVIASGVGVVAVVASTSLGAFVALDHGDGFFTYYGGLDQVLVTEGMRVQRGASLGSLPVASRPSLHFGARLVGAQIDPVTLPGIALRVPDSPGTARQAATGESDRRGDFNF
jgi:murein DD-endopeptidase MepM/ murein hydrolase activator NlpD